MAQTNTTATLDGFFKSVYGESHIAAVPEGLWLVKNVDFRESEKIGKQFEVPVILSQEHGVTYLASGDGATTLNASIAAVSKNATVDGAQIILRGQIDYEAAAKAQTSKGSFQKTTELLVQNLVDSASNRLEIMFLYGGTGLGVAASSVNTNTTTTVIQVSTATFAAGIWAGMENATLQFYKTSDASLISSSTNSIFTVSSVDMDNRKLTVTGTTTGIAALDTALGSVTCDIYFNGSKGKECSGLDKMMVNSGTLFGISASTYTLWKATSYSAGSAALTMTKVLSAQAKAVAKGGLQEDTVLLCNPATWNNLNSDQAALRNYDSSYSSAKAENGSESLVYHGVGGKITVVPHAKVKEGEAFLFPKKRIKRIGAQDLSFKTPGRQDEIFLHIPDVNAYELRIYGNQALFGEMPAKMVKITGIVNS
jgi:hypothetical protein